MVSHVIYPLIQALNIEYLDLDLAVGGTDQRKVHALQRDILVSIGCIESLDGIVTGR